WWNHLTSYVGIPIALEDRRLLLDQALEVGVIPQYVFLASNIKPSRCMSHPLTECRVGVVYSILLS
ncbi:hypothetical protein Gotur_015522, partial [Gossypium turneri]